MYQLWELFLKGRMYNVHIKVFQHLFKQGNLNLMVLMKLLLRSKLERVFTTWVLNCFYW